MFEKLTSVITWTPAKSNPFKEERKQKNKRDDVIEGGSQSFSGMNKGSKKVVTLKKEKERGIMKRKKWKKRVQKNSRKKRRCQHLE